MGRHKKQTPREAGFVMVKQRLQLPHHALLSGALDAAAAHA
jgi:hypothetical protein